MRLNDAPPMPLSAPPAVAPASLALVVAAVLAVFALYAGTVASIVHVWNSSETFAHGYVILPMSLWLGWRRRALFAAIPAAPYWPALGLLALLGAGWLLAYEVQVQVVMQYAFVAMLPTLALALLGPRLARAFAFPLLFLLFAVPFGEIFIGPLINFTADFTVAAVRAVGIPVLRNGTHFELPTGSWSVVDACSGIRYLISSITLGCLYAYLSYRSLARRLMFVAVSIVVPVIANGLRAFMIVMIGHTSGMRLATGVDHIIYGWLFFGLVMFVMFWIGSRWRQDPEPVPVPAPGAALASATPAATARAVLAALVVAGAWPLLAHVADRAAFNPRPALLPAPQLRWASAPAADGWQPHYMTPDAQVHAAYAPPAAAGASPVTLTVLYYRNQRRDKSLISSVNRLSVPGDEIAQVASSLRTETVGARRLVLRESRMTGPAGHLLVWHWLWIDGQTTANDYAGKLLQARARLLMHNDDGAAIMLSMPYGESPDRARAELRQFLADNLAPLDAALASAREH